MGICFYEHLRLFEGVELADIEQPQVFLLIAKERALMAVLQVEVDNTESFRHPSKEGKRLRGDHVYAAERQRSSLVATNFTGFNVLPTTQAHLIVKL